ncbi:MULTISPECIES: hypothetical protein [Mycobacterium]|uniref:Uncharacterized protein n=1 Tax=Mycobacterium syngnathidarum TaxID=1908205 RepID=A0A1Q9W8Q8_9MYCO|nr:MULTISPECIES: hypothetical protein [Mycobacterium]MCG7611282.1 hypothetical protein [Mycobacterium sp. CnD-18-1]OHT80926.1 hypothetical protein BKG61_29920 [Mycobacterium syngnathidarum]OLT95180.1 hypothetical protein BKG60_18040 [Mycobacterium syngnathidarum]TMS45745.1 hypothetical protein E0T84_30875 [Mycobacterium sp. DBP42]
MAHLHVDTGSLSAAAAQGDAVAATLASTGAAGEGSGSQPSHAGVSAIDAALASARDRQAARVSNHSEYMKVGSGVYRRTDDDGADAVARTV